MKKKIRNKCFETNSSSTHSLVIAGERLNNIELPKNMIENGVFVIKQKYCPITFKYSVDNCYIKYKTFVEKLYYLAGYCLYIDMFREDDYFTSKIEKIVSEYFNIPVKICRDKENKIWHCDGSEDELDSFILYSTDDDIRNFLFNSKSCVNIKPLGSPRENDPDWEPDYNDNI